MYEFRANFNSTGFLIRINLIFGFLMLLKIFNSSILQVKMKCINSGPISILPFYRLFSTDQPNFWFLILLKIFNSSILQKKTECMKSGSISILPFYGIFSTDQAYFWVLSLLKIFNSSILQEKTKCCL